MCLAFMRLSTSTPIVVALAAISIACSGAVGLEETDSSGWAAECIPGSIVQKWSPFPASYFAFMPERFVYGIDTFELALAGVPAVSPSSTMGAPFPLELVVPSAQSGGIDGAIRVPGDDWCYLPGARTIELTRSPARAEMLDGRRIDLPSTGTAIWVYYVPEPAVPR